MGHISRRRFLKIAGFGAGAAALATGGAADAAGDGRQARRRRDAHRPDVVRHLLLEVQRHRTRARWPPMEDRRQPGGSAVPRPALPARHRRHRRALRPDRAARPADPAHEARCRGVGRGHLGRGARLRRRADAEDQGHPRSRGHGAVQPRHRRQFPEAHAEGLRQREHRGAVVRAVPRPARRRLRAHVRRGHRLARAHRHRERPLPGADRFAPRREHAQHAGAGVLDGDCERRHDHRRRPPLLDRGQQGQALPAGEARHRHRPAARVDERAGRGRPVRP